MKKLTVWLFLALALVFVPGLSACGREDNTAAGAALPSVETDTEAVINPIVEDFYRNFRQDDLSDLPAFDSDFARQQLYALESGDQWGVINGLGEIIIEPQHDYCVVFGVDTPMIYIANRANQQDEIQILNAQLEPVFTEYDIVQPRHIPSHSGYWTYDEHYLDVCRNGKWGLIDYQGNTVIPSEYDGIADWDQTRYVPHVFTTVRGDKTGVWDARIGMVAPAEYWRVQSFVVRDGKLEYYTVWRDIKDSYTQVLTPEGKWVFNGALYALGDEEYVAWIQEGATDEGSFFWLDKDLNTICRIVDNPFPIWKNDGITVLIHDNVLLERDGVTGLMSRNGDIILDFDTWQIEEYGEYVSTISGNARRVYTSEGEFLHEEPYQQAGWQPNAVETPFDEAEGFMVEVHPVHDDGPDLLTVRYDGKARVFTGDLRHVTQALFADVKVGCYGIICVKAEGESGKWAYYDASKDSMLTGFDYDDARSMDTRGYALVKINGLWGGINIMGDLVAQPSMDDVWLMERYYVNEPHILGPYRYIDAYESAFYTDSSQDPEIIRFHLVTIPGQ